MEPIVIADTDVLIDFFSGVEPAASSVSELIEGDRLALTSITVFELYADIIGKRRLKQIDDLVSLVRVFPLERRDSEIAAKVYSDLKRVGKLIGNQDILIASICLNRNIPLMTRNAAHFSRISSLKLYPPQDE